MPRDLIICFLGGFQNEEIHFLDGQVEVNGIPGGIVRWLRPKVIGYLDILE